MGIDESDRVKAASEPPKHTAGSRQVRDASALDEICQKLAEKMRSAESRDAARKLLAASPEDLGKAAVRAAARGTDTQLTIS